MLNKRVPDLSDAVWDAVAKVGMNPAKVADRIIKDVFPRTLAEAMIEGADRMLRVGLIDAVKPMLRGGAVSHAQGDFSEIDPAFEPLVAELKSAAYFVEALGEQVPVARLIAEPDLLDDARKFMRRKGDECIAEALRLDLLHNAVVREAARTA
jgi:hypothetical protein